MNELYPLMFKLNNKRVVIIGAGRVALRKAQGLQLSGAFITVISPTILPELQAMPEIQWRKKCFEPQDICDAHLIYAATDNPQVNQQVGEAIADWQWFNDTSQPERSNFYTPAVVRTNEATLSISTGGKNPTKAKQIKQALMGYFGASKSNIT